MKNNDSKLGLDLPISRRDFMGGVGIALSGSLLACLVKIARSKGLAGLYQGFLATWMRLGPWAFLFFVCFEQYRATANKLTAASSDSDKDE